MACYLCQKHLDGWEESDDPWIAHIEHGKIKVTSSSRRKAEEILKCPLVSLESYPSRLATFVNWPHKHKASMKATPETVPFHAVQIFRLYSIFLASCQKQDFTFVQRRILKT